MAAKGFINVGKSVTTRMSAVPSNALAIGTMGAFVGGIAATATNTYKVTKGELGKAEAAKNVAQETLGTGLATAAGAAVTTVLGLGGVVGLAGLLVVATLTKEAWDQAMSETEKRAAKK
jgi:hypothetical protein